MVAINLIYLKTRRFEMREQPEIMFAGVGVTPDKNVSINDRMVVIRSDTKRYELTGGETVMYEQLY